nr:winged helix-turn-helix domain-containing protein [Sphingobacterium mizutaii]
MEYLMVNKNKVISRMDILEEVWEMDINMSTNVVDVYVNYLRKKIDKIYENKLIHTVIGLGYVMRNEN